MHPIARRLLARLSTFTQEEDGLVLLDSVLSALLLSGMVVIFLTALATHSIATRSVDANSIAIQLARSQAEQVRYTQYRYYGGIFDSYPVTVTAPSGYSITMTTTSVSFFNLQRVTVTARRGSATIFTTDIYKVMTVFADLCEPIFFGIPCTY